MFTRKEDTLSVVIFFVILLAALTLTLSTIGVVVEASDSYTVSAGSTRDITAHGICQRVTNNNGLSLYVPTTSSAEWSSFRSYPPSGVSLGSCVTHAWYTGGWGGCSKSCGTGVRYRTVYCRGSDGRSYADSYCSDSKPATWQYCNTNYCPSPAGYINLAFVSSTPDPGGYYNPRVRHNSTNVYVPALSYGQVYDSGWQLSTYYDSKGPWTYVYVRVRTGVSNTGGIRIYSVYGRAYKPGQYDVSSAFSCSSVQDNYLSGCSAYGFGNGTYMSPGYFRAYPY